ncbi:MAG TPA: metalloregulator ArsR/SmtB family transcription factor [Burkholderiales bacterium]|nr:metalloregulator ArsR/SmtB family transcription factor [Burkholderiales bacterium]
MAERRDTDLLFKALADPGRRKLLDLLHASDGQTLNQLCEHLDMTRQGVTQHLGLLEAANLVATVRRGREKLHFLNPVPLQEIYERWIAKFEKPRLKALSDLKQKLEKTHA